VYRFLSKEGEILYVGKAKNLKSRVSSYFTSQSQLLEKTRQLVSQIEKIEVTVVESEIESLLLEAYYIKKFSPKYNVKMTDGKAYPLIEIRMQDAYPEVLLARRPVSSKAMYFGPFPSTQSVKQVLKLVRRISPFVSVPNHAKRICLYHHLGLCPCPPVFDSLTLKKEYRKQIRRVIKILEGKSESLLKDLTKERDAAAKGEDFETAQTLQKRINSLEYITQPVHRPFEYDVNPNLRSDIRMKELTDLQTILRQAGYNVAVPLRIECYDISHIQGTNTTASMVVFTNGEKDAGQYRKYKIRLKKTPDDFASMQEVLTRRLRHTEWEYPDLFIVDGGKGQVSATLEVFKEKGIEIPLIGLAKRIETVVIPTEHPKFDKTVVKHGKSEEFVEVVIPHDQGALQLLQRIRDEAHRFAITYHRKLRSKSAISA
jgi:excinuclease ABC subunit C